MGNIFEELLDNPKFEEYADKIYSEFGFEPWVIKPNVGGVADGKALVDFDLDQILMGIKSEMEHTNDPNVALGIAADHLSSMPHYYTKLEKMEKEAGVEE